MISRKQIFLSLTASFCIASKYASAFSPHCSGTTLLATNNLKNQYSPSSLSSAVMETETQSEPLTESSLKSGRSQLSDPTTKNDWSFVDRVYLITCPNADPNSERLNKAKEILDRVGLLDQVEVKQFDTDDEDRIRGCYASHISVLRDGLRDIQLTKSNTKNGEDWWGSLISVFDNNNNESIQEKAKARDQTTSESTRPKCILVLEDNLEFSGSLDSEIFSSISDYLKSDKGADMIHLSYIPYVPNLTVSKTDDKKIVGLSTGQSSALGTTAYVITERAIETLIQEDAINGFRAPIPDVMAEQFPLSRFSVYPTPFLRAPKIKSLVNPQLDDLRELLFLPPVVAQFQNVLALTGLSTNTLFFATIGGLVVAGGIAGMGVTDAVNQFLTTGSYDGNLVLLVANAIFTTFSIAIIAQGAALAPKPPEDVEASA